MKKGIWIVFVGMLTACGGEKKVEPGTTADMESSADMGMQVAPPPGPPPGGSGPPGACRIVGIPQKSSCRLSSLRLQNCPDCPPDQRHYHSGHLVKVDGVDHGFESGAYQIPAAREVEFKQFMEKNSPVPCGGMIVHPPCNPAGTHMELEMTWPEWIRRERM